MFSNRFYVAAALLGAAVIAPVTLSAPASAITVELAKQCRDLSLKAFPPQRVGTKAGNSGESRKYYTDCVDNNGKVPEDKQPKPAAAPAPAR